MNWYYNLRLGTKLISGFVLVALIAVSIGLIGVMNIQKMEAEGARVYEKITVPLAALQDMTCAYLQIRVAVRDMVLEPDPTKNKPYIARIRELSSAVEKDAIDLEKTILTDEGRKLFAEFTDSWKKYRGVLDRALQLGEQDQDVELKVLMKGDLATYGVAAYEALDKIVTAKVTQAKLTAQSNAALAKDATRSTTILALFGALLAVGLGFFITRIVQSQLGGGSSGGGRHHPQGGRGRPGAGDRYQGETG